MLAPITFHVNKSQIHTLPPLQLGYGVIPLLAFYSRNIRMAAEESKSASSETATKAASESVFPNDSPAQTGPSMGVSDIIHYTKFLAKKKLGPLRYGQRDAYAPFENHFSDWLLIIYAASGEAPTGVR